MVTPFEALINDLLLKTWPRKDTKTETKDSSIVLAKSAKMTEAVSGVNLPPRDWIIFPYLGCIIAMTRYIPENIVEYTDKMRMDIESQLLREE